MKDHHAPSACPDEVLAAIRDMSVQGEAFLRTWDHYVTTILAAGETALTMGGWPAVNTLLAAWGPTVVGAQLRMQLQVRGLAPGLEARQDPELVNRIRQTSLEEQEPRVVH